MAMYPASTRRCSIRAALRPVPVCLLAAAAAALLTGCATTGYYAQAIGGQIELWRLAQPIETVVADAATAPALKAKLDAVQAIRAFASRELGLPDNGSYRSYADVKRPFVAWNVFAADALSLHAQEWCFPVVGCVGYRGYFSRDGADAFARELRAQGLDVYVGGVPAYSTLGWFNDPVLSTFINYPASELARLLFHELAHQIVYVKDDSTFNESFAVAVETAGVARWLASRPEAPGARQTYETWQARRRDYLALIERYRERLDALYRSPATREEKLAVKQALFDEMRRDYAALKVAWGGYAGYDRIFAGEINNALIASVAIYTQRVPAFQALLAREGGDLPRFYAAVKTLAKLPKAERDARLAALESGATQPTAQMN